jgi:hypothetical protein
MRCCVKTGTRKSNRLQAIRLFPVSSASARNELLPLAGEGLKAAVAQRLERENT